MTNNFYSDGDSLSLDFTDSWRIRIEDPQGSYTYHWLGHTDYFTAEMIADNFRGGVYDLALPSDSSVTVEIDCHIHGWTPAPFGFCAECGDAAAEACLDALYGELNEEDDNDLFHDPAEIEDIPF
jgi:hypothetical protein